MPRLLQTSGVCQTPEVYASRLRNRLGAVPFLALFLLLACASAQSTPEPSQAEAGRLAGTPPAAPTQGAPTADLALPMKEVTVGPLPLRAGFPFTITAQLHNNTATPALDVPLMVYLSPQREEIGYQPFFELITVTLPTTQPVTVKLPVRWNLAGGEHRLWVQLNRLPRAWQAQAPTLPETDTGDNVVWLDLMIQPFDAYESDLCPGRVDVELNPPDVSAAPGQQQVAVRVHNEGNRAVYNLPVVVTGQGLAGIGYSPAIPPCGGTGEVLVPVDRLLKPGEALAVEVNPPGWEGGQPEDEFDNNRAAAAVRETSTLAGAPGLGLPEYDFSIGPADVTSPEAFILLVTVHNHGTRDAARVPILLQNLAGRKLTDVIPLVQGEGQGVAAIRVGYLWTRGGTLTLTVNPQAAKGAYPESDHSNNVTTFKLP
jgi:hypothetical protein